MKRVSLGLFVAVAVVAVFIGGIAAYYATSAQSQDQPPSADQPPSVVGSVKVPTRLSTLVSLAKIDMLKAINAATERQSGTVFAAHLREHNGYLVYGIAILAADGSAVLVTVDAGDGKVLSVTKLPMGGRFGHFGPMGPGGKRGGR